MFISESNESELHIAYNVLGEVKEKMSKDKVRLRGNVKAFYSAMALYNFVRLYTSEVLVLIARNAVRFVDGNPLSSRSFAESFLPILSEYGLTLCEPLMTQQTQSRLSLSLKIL